MSAWLPILVPLLHAGAFVQALTWGLNTVPSALKVTLAAAMAALAVSFTGVASLHPAAAVVGGLLAGTVAGLPLRGLLHGARTGAAGLAPGASAVADAAVLLGGMAWMDAGGLEGVVQGYLASADAMQGLGPGALLAPDLVSRLGSLFYASVFAGALPALAFVLGVGAFLGLLSLGRGRPLWLPCLTAALSLGFLMVWTRSLPGEVQAAIQVGLELLGVGQP